MRSGEEAGTGAGGGGGGGVGGVGMIRCNSRVVVGEKGGGGGN